MITVGLDTRIQSARWGGLTDKSERETMLMQASPYLVIQPVSWFYAEGFYNFAYEIETSKRYPGQESYAFSGNFKFGDNLPTLRAGYFQPTIGTKYDDHTLLIRQIAGNSRMPLIPDDYAEWGAQVDYEALKIDKVSFGLSAGVFDSKNMLKLPPMTDKNGKNVTVVDTNSISTVLRLGIYPELGHGINAFAGGYYLFNGDYSISGAFLNIGLVDKICLMTEYMRSDKKDVRLTQNFLTELSYQVYEWGIPFVRYERAQTANYNENVSGATYPYYTNQYVFGAHIFLLPYIEFLPEYRIFDREHVDGQFSQWAFQIHFFY
jgi:hypothetical protein